jgi:hypothetical protein
MTDVRDDAPEPTVAAIVRVAERTQTTSDEATIEVIFRDEQMIDEANLDVVVKTYIGCVPIQHIG